jgi:tetratricopeptide (TPR) repeat protein
MARSRTPVPVGELAIELGMISRHHVLGALAEQIDSRMEALMSLESGRFRFYRGPVAPMEPDLEPRTMEWLVARTFFGLGLRRREILERFLDGLRGRGLSITRNGSELISLFRFGEGSAALAGLLDGRPIDRIAASSPIPEAETEAIVYLLWAAGGIDLLDQPLTPESSLAPPVAPLKPDAEPGPTRATTPGMPPVPSPRDPTGTQALLDEASSAIGRRDYSRALLLLHVAKEKDPDSAEVLAALGWAVFRAQPGSKAVRSQARKLLEESLAINADEISALVALGKIARIEGDLATAQILCEHVLGIDPDNETAQRELQHLQLRTVGHPDASSVETTDRFVRDLLKPS